MRVGTMLACLATASVAWTGLASAQLAKPPVSSDTSIPLMPAREIPVYNPGAIGDGKNSATLNPLAPAGLATTTATTPSPTTNKPPTTTKPPAMAVSPSPRPTTLRPASSSPSPRPTQPPVLDLNFFTPTPSSASVEGNECGVNYKYGSAAVSVLGTGTFCSETPVCSGLVNGSCPGVQPGLAKAARCALLPDGGAVYGCLPQ